MRAGLSLLLLVALLAACSATPITIPYREGGLPSTDMAPHTGADAGSRGDSNTTNMPDSGVEPGPGCGDGGDATCADGGLGDATLEAGADAASELGLDLVLADEGSPLEGGTEDCCAAD